MPDLDPPTPAHRVYLSLGSNIEAVSNLRSALRALREQFGPLSVSPVYQTKAIGFDGEDFLNLAVAIDTNLDVLALDSWLHALEDAHGRRRDQPRFSARTLDIDIVLFDDLIVSGPGNLQLPRPELEHAFVLKPLFDLNPRLVVPGTQRSLAMLWAEHADREAPQWNSTRRFD